MATTHKTIHDAVDKFLAQRRLSSVGGGWAAITPGDINDLDNIIHLLVDAKCEADADGDRPIQWMLVNRRIEFHPALRFGVLKYSDRDANNNKYQSYDYNGNRTDINQNYETLMDNIRTAGLCAESYLRQIQLNSEVLMLFDQCVDFSTRRSLKKKPVDKLQKTG